MSNSPSSSEHHPTPPIKRRRGRQPRPSLLSDQVKAAVARFALAVGQPKLIEPAGFRDFRGWLAHIANPSAYPYWAPLVHAVIHDCHANLHLIHAIKPDLVREIVKAVVIPKHGESSKLVSTNCGRQCARPSSGLTLISILDTIFTNLRQWKHFYSAHPTPPFPHYPHAPILKHSSTASLQPNPSAARAKSSATHHPSNPRTQSNLPSLQTLLPHQTSKTPSSCLVLAPAASDSPHRHPPAPTLLSTSNTSRTSLPSFRELEDSLLPPVSLGKRCRP